MDHKHRPVTNAVVAPFLQWPRPTKVQLPRRAGVAETTPRTLSPRKRGGAPQWPASSRARSLARVRPVDTSAFPFRCVAQLYATGRNGTTLGTGFFISPRCIITSGHLVYAEGSWADEVLVVPGQVGTRMPFGAAAATTFWSVRGWTTSPDPDYDYGAIILPDQALFSRVGAHFDFGVDDAPRILHNSGYPAHARGSFQQLNGGPVMRVCERKYYYWTANPNCQSGSPVWVNDGPTPVVIGIHSQGGRPSSAIRCGEEMALNWAHWSRA